MFPWTSSSTSDCLGKVERAIYSSRKKERRKNRRAGRSKMGDEARVHCGFSIIRSIIEIWIRRKPWHHVLFAFNRVLFSFSRTRSRFMTGEKFYRSPILDDRSPPFFPFPFYEREVVYAAGNKLASIRLDSVVHASVWGLDRDRINRILSLGID